MVAYAKPQERKKVGDRLTGERAKIKFIDLTFERGQIVHPGKEDGRMFHRLRVLRMNGAAI